jgi:hypothetical protein
MWFGRRTSNSTTAGGWAAVANGLDGCLLFVVIGAVSAPAGVCGMFLWATWDGWKRAFTPEFVQLLLLTLLGVSGVIAILTPLCWLVVSYFHSRRPEGAIVTPPAATYIVGANGAHHPMPSQSPALPAPTEQAPLRLPGNQIARRWVGGVPLRGTAPSANGAPRNSGGIGWRQ